MRFVAANRQHGTMHGLEDAGCAQTTIIKHGARMLLPGVAVERPSLPDRDCVFDGSGRDEYVPGKGPAAGYRVKEELSVPMSMKPVRAQRRRRREREGETGPSGGRRMS